MSENSLKTQPKCVFLFLDQQVPIKPQLQLRGRAVEVNLKLMPEKEQAEALQLKKLFFSTQHDAFAVHEEMIDQLKKRGITTIDIEYLDGHTITVKRDDLVAVEEKVYQEAFDSFFKKEATKESVESTHAPFLATLSLEMLPFPKMVVSDFLSSIACQWGEIVRRVNNLLKEAAQEERMRAKEAAEKETKNQETRKEERAAKRKITTEVQKQSVQLQGLPIIA